jgi:Insulinase (Peptidase family M16)/Peptidase M16 inactive domain
MKRWHYPIKLTIFSLVLLLLTGAVSAQKPGSTTPRTEKLLNGLKILMWNEPKSDKVTLKIRVHAGSSFDPQQKEGVMQLLADSIFPNETAKEFFTEELGGSLSVECNYDYIQVSATGQSDRMLEILQTLANAVENPTIDKETTAKLKSALLAKVGALEKDPAYIADRAAAKRLFGTFPYGRPQMGSTESIKKIEFPDLLDAKQRFLDADNATVTLTGNYNPDLAFRAIRRYLGAWLKSDKKVPPTFRQPDAPDEKPEILGSITSGDTEARFALRGIARSDKDIAASEILTKIAAARWQAASLRSTNHRVVNEARILPGYILFGLTMPPQPAGDTSGAKPGAQLIPKNITDAEFAKAKAEVLAEFGARNLQDRWLDVDTYKGLAVDNENAAYQDATLADVQRLADRLAKNPVVTVFSSMTPAEPVKGN